MVSFPNCLIQRMLICILIGFTNLVVLIGDDALRGEG